MGLRGLELPNHPYQVVLGVLTIALAYHRRWLLLPSRPVDWLLAPLNALAVSVLFKLVIGSGIRHPLWWLRYPAIQFRRDTGKWLEVLPDLQLNWNDIPLAGWEIDLTRMQTFLLMITLIGGLFRFQPFVSFTAFFLILVSLPAFASFDWTWIFPAMATTAVALYLQASNRREWG
jgi:hypothetical protein